ncbi:transporter substrate-binding domain-containing protein [Labrys monachus]|uniref:Polar amino acid transport system substrate-binding protein n=1 Tax=Labrys monachus TaxID=217067 RepID=A0ABU0FD93_9HYPH|nr:transporter substrate-binding domain-containing protein [Labrys monachus]MDQ0392574.1 polar amino acid transport system substrate-binding protein [Labrys monachus]
MHAGGRAGRPSPRRTAGRRLAVLAAAVAWLALQGPPAPAADLAATGPYGLWDPHRRPEKPDLRTIRQIRFLTEDDFPPFDFQGSSGALEGFNVDIARAICHQLQVSCTIQARRWDTIVAALEAGQADVIAASLVPTAQARARLQFSMPYYVRPARFVMRGAAASPTLTAAGLAGRRLGVVAGTAHEAYARAYFARASLVPYASEEALRAALQQGAVGLAFGDGIGLSLWLNGSSSAGCCVFAGSPYLDSHFFGDGIGMALRRDDTALRQAIDFALFQIWEQGVYADLIRRWFPVDPFAQRP